MTRIPTQTFLDFAAALGAADFTRKGCIWRWTHYYWAESPELSQDIKFTPPFRCFLGALCGPGVDGIWLQPGTGSRPAPAMHCRMTEIV
jgi:hypothetical protein